jgi:iron-sulfur cluster repair protein YtfE (RIC family)
MVIPERSVSQEAEVAPMTSPAADSRAMIQSFVEHEHDELVAGIDHVHEVARELPNLPANVMSSRVLGVLHWVDRSLRPHMEWEEGWLLPQLRDREESAWAARIVHFDHRQIGHLVERLSAHRLALEHGGPSSAAALDVRCDLFALEALLRANLEREASFLLPLLDGDASWTSPSRA